MFEGVSKRYVRSSANSRNSPPLVIPEDCYRETILSSYFDEKKEKDMKRESSNEEGNKDSLQDSGKEDQIQK
jgi:hypothetical protein